jgi:hypothetical protein
VRSSVFSLNLHHPTPFLRSPNSSFYLLRRLPVTSILPSIFP